MQGLIFNIQRFTVNDGPGIRTTVFMKGCPLNCLWCHNPESQKMMKELIFVPTRCKACGACTRVCPTSVHAIDPIRKVEFEKCILCGKCTQACVYKALEIVGSWKPVEEVIREVERDEAFYSASGGGITISGGEPALQPDFVSELCRLLKRRGLHVALDTSGYSGWDAFEKILHHVDLILFDIKHMDSHTHKKLTGVSNEPIIRNFTRMLAYGKQIIVRFPLIPGHNDEDDNLGKLAAFLSHHGIRRLDVIPYHTLGIPKYRHLGRTYTLDGLVVPPKEYVDRKIAFFQRYNIHVQLL